MSKLKEKSLIILISTKQLLYIFIARLSSGIQKLKEEIPNYLKFLIHIELICILDFSHVKFSLDNKENERSTVRVT